MSMFSSGSGKPNGMGTNGGRPPSAISGPRDLGNTRLKMPLLETLRLAWADSDIRERLKFVLMVFAVYALGVHIPVPIPGISTTQIEELVRSNPIFQMIDTFGGGGLKRISIFALGLNPYITASIIIQILTATTPHMKKELQEGGEYARKQQNKRTRLLSLTLCFFQGWGFMQMMGSAFGGLDIWVKLTTILFWTAGTLCLLWLGEQISEKGIGNGTSLIIFSGIVISLPGMLQLVSKGFMDGIIQWYEILMLLVIFLSTTWFVVLFTTAQRRIPIQHMRRQVGMKTIGGSTSYLPLSLNLAGVIPIIFAVSLVYLPTQFSTMFAEGSVFREVLSRIGDFLRPDFTHLEGYIGCVLYSLLIFFFSYFYTAIQYNVEDIANNLKKGGSFIPGIRPGNQTREFLDGVISRLTFVGSLFLAVIALMQYGVPLIVGGVQGLSTFFGTSLLILVSVALETMRQIEANILMKKYGQS